MMAIKKQNNNRYLVDIRNTYNERIRKVFDRKQDAIAYEAKIKKENYEAKLIEAKMKRKRYKIKDALSEFIASKNSLRPVSIKKYRSVTDQIELFASAMNIEYLDEFSPDAGTMFYNELIRERIVDKKNHTIRKKAAPKTVNFYISTLKSFFNEEVIKDHILRSPVLHLKRVKNNRMRPDYYSVEELIKFFEQKMQPHYRNFFLCLLFAGLRYNEAANLTWDNVNFKKKILFIRSTEKNRLKTENSERSIPMGNSLLQLLSTIRKNNNSELVFQNRHNLKIKERRALSVCKAVGKAAGLESRMTLHKFRSTYATLLVRNNISLESIKELLGHSSVIITEQSYANNESSRLHSDVDTLDSILSEIKTQNQ